MLLNPWAGYLIAVAGKLFGILSYLFMKVANHKVEQSKNEGKEVKAYCTASWIIGFICVLVGSILNLIALPFCDLVLISTTVGIAILFNNVVAMWWLGEKIVYKYDIPAFILIVAGSTAIVLLSVDGDETYTPQDIKELLY